MTAENITTIQQIETDIVPFEGFKYPARNPLFVPLGLLGLLIGAAGAIMLLPGAEEGPTGSDRVAIGLILMTIGVVSFLGGFFIALSNDRTAEQTDVLNYQAVSAQVERLATILKAHSIDTTDDFTKTTTNRLAAAWNGEHPDVLRSITIEQDGHKAAVVTVDGFSNPFVVQVFSTPTNT